MIFTPLIPALCIGLVWRSVTQTPIRYESHSTPIAIWYSVTGAFATNGSYDAPTANLIKELKWPTVYDMIKKETAAIVCKSISGLAPTYLSTLFTRNSTRQIVNFRNPETDLLAARMKTSHGQKAFAFRGSKVWNELEHEVKLAPSLSTLKRSFLIFHLF